MHLSFRNSIVCERLGKNFAAKFLGTWWGGDTRAKEDPIKFEILHQHWTLALVEDALCKCTSSFEHLILFSSLTSIMTWNLSVCPAISTIRILGLKSCWWGLYRSDMFRYILKMLRLRYQGSGGFSLMLVEALLGRFFWVLHFVPKKTSAVSEWLCHAVHTHQPLSSLSRDWWWVYKQPDGLGPLAPQSSQHRCEGDQRQQNHMQRPAGVFQGQNKAPWWYAQQPDSVLSLFKGPYFHIWLMKCNKWTFSFVLFFCI